MIQYFIGVVIPKRNRSGNQREYFITAAVNWACFSLYTLPFRIGFYRIDKLTKEVLIYGCYQYRQFCLWRNHGRIYDLRSCETRLIFKVFSLVREIPYHILQYSAQKWASTQDRIRTYILMPYHLDDLCYQLYNEGNLDWDTVIFINTL